MRPLLILALLLSLAACAKEEKKKEESKPPALKLASIPEGCTILYGPSVNTVGSHEFRGVGILYATAFDCGVREGRQCYYYLHVSATGQPIQDTRCE